MAGRDEAAVIAGLLRNEPSTDTFARELEKGMLKKGGGMAS